METPEGCLICHVDEAVDPGAALSVAESLAMRLGHQLVLVMASPSLVPGLPDSARERLVRADGDEVLGSAAGALERGTTTIERIEPGDPATRLAAVAEEERARLVVVSSGGHGPLLAGLLGRPHVELAARGPCPVVVVPQSLGAHDRLGGPVVCGVDGSDESLGAARVAANLAGALTAPLLLANVAPAAARVSSGKGVEHTAWLRSELRSSRRVLDRALSLLPDGLEADVAIERGDPAEHLVGVAMRCGAELVVVGARGVGPLRSAVLGSVSADLVAWAPVPVVIVPRSLRRQAPPVLGRAAGAQTAAEERDGR